MILIDITNEQILKARKALLLSQKDIAKALGINITSYAAIERGESDPRISNYRKIVHFFIQHNITFHKDNKIEIKNRVL